MELRVFGATWDKSDVIRAEQYSKTLGCWCKSSFDLIHAAYSLSGISGFVTVNPVNPVLLARGQDRLRKLRREEGTNDADIVSLSWLYIDVDSVRPTGVPATQEEVMAAIGRRDTILDEMAGFRESAIWGCSGNGGWICVRLPNYPNDDLHRSAVKQALVTLAARFNDKTATVDVKTSNPSRIMCLPGTRKCKGTATADRPYRWVTMDSPESTINPPPIDLIGWLNEQGKTITTVPFLPPPPPSATQAREGREEPVTRRAAAYLARMAPAVSGAAGHAQTFDAACALVLGFGLATEDARPLLAEYNARCKPPWTDEDLDHKLEDADRRGGDRGYLLKATQDRQTGWATVALAAPQGAGDGDMVAEGMEDNPHRLARMFWNDRYQKADGPTLRYWMGEFWAWDGAAYRKTSREEMRCEITSAVEAEFIRLFALAAMRNSLATQGGDGEGKRPRPIGVTTRLVGDIIQALAGICLLSARDYPRQPAWVGRESSWAAEDMLPCRNAVVHLPSFAAGDVHYSCPPTPKFFSPYCLDYEFDANAPVPAKWMTFLGQLWPNDPQAIATLQEWMGLQLVPNTSYQKIGCLIGPKRSGKGTIARVLRAMVGPENCVGPTLASFAMNFGLAPLIGKQTAIIDDARMSAKTDQAQITERLLTISGEGDLTIDRKFKEPWTGRLQARITYVSNELPRLMDPSGALTNRFLVIRMTRSFFGQEDNQLTEKLLAELPGILLWSIQGLKRLTDRGRFIQPDSSNEMFDEMEELSSPITAFVRDCLEENPGDRESIQDIYRAWVSWCGQKGEKNPGNEAHLSRNLRSVLPDLETKLQRNDAGARQKFFLGIRLRYDPSNIFVPFVTIVPPPNSRLASGEAIRERKTEDPPGDGVPF